MLRGQRVEYDFERKAIRHVHARIRADGSLYVSAPYLTPTAMVERLLTDRQDWILSHLARRAESAERAKNELFLWGERLTLCVRQGRRGSAVREGDRLVLALRDPTDAEQRQRVLESWQKRVCAEGITALVRKYYPAFESRGVPVPSLSFRRMRSRWGSCRPQKGAMSFNTRLAELPPECAGYVVVHELAHFLQPNHSPAFYAEVQRVLPDWKTRREQLHAWEKTHPL